MELSSSSSPGGVDRGNPGGADREDAVGAEYANPGEADREDAGETDCMNLGSSNSTNYNGILYPADRPLLTADNRGFRYGDGIFETLFVRRGGIRLAGCHFERL
ncbi:MAG: hypothetical protein JST42_10615, partial [Bacteroidetes bacterium]|nr:hypothetical protein [Bacteroidota bacterium]